MDPGCAAGILQHRAREVGLAEVSKIQSPEDSLGRRFQKSETNSVSFWKNT